MLSFTKKKDATISAENISRPAPSKDDFIPYYSHYNANTLLTKNGELLKIIKITGNTQGLNYEGGGASHETVRETIRKAVTNHIHNDHFAFWIHTVRKRTPIKVGGKFSQDFASYVHESWQKKHNWEYKYYNEVYITILHEGQAAELLNFAHFKDTFLPSRNRKFRNRYLEDISQRLDKAVSAIANDISPHFDAHILGLQERIPEPDDSPSSDPIFYSEPMEFLGTLLNLSTDRYPLPEADISQILNNRSITFGYNALETKHANGERHFGAMLTLKQYQEAPIETIDHILQSPTELIITHCFDFVSHKKALKTVKAQKEWFDISGDAYSMKATGLHDMLKSHNKRPVDFVEQQTSIMVIVDEYKNLEPAIIKTQNNFGELGMTTVREDIMLEECFWSQLPGNFEFIRRKAIIPTSQIAGFSRLNRFPTGENTGTHWHEMLTVVPTQVSSPYFFNFHVQDNGHTLVQDFNSFNDAYGNILTNFLLTSSLKYDGKLFIFDHKRASYLLCDKLDTQYHDMDAKTPITLNPFLLEASPRNASFLLAWCCSLIEPSFTVTTQHRELIRSAIEQLYEGEKHSQHMQGFMQILSLLDAPLAEAFRTTIDGIEGCRFGANEEADMNKHITAFSMDSLRTNNPSIMVAIFAYLLHRIITNLDGTPTIIVLREAQTLLENDFFAPRLESLMEMLVQNNVILICTTSSPHDHANARSIQTLLHGCATKIIIPDDINYEYTSQALGISMDDSRLLSRMSRESGDFMLLQKDTRVALRVDLHELGDIKAIMANDIKTLISAGGKFASLPKQ
ncbi:MAG: hypothetical protein ACN2B6_11200 [Rickettsiales bacterium]